MTMRPCYAISSDEPLLRDEAIEKIVRLAYQQGYTAVKRWHIDSGFDWARWVTHIDQPNLFGEQALLILSFNTSQLNAQASKAIRHFLTQPQPHCRLVLSCPKLDKASLNSPWLKAIKQYGTLLQLWPPEITGLQQWLAHKAAAYGLQISDTALSRIAANSEGNLTAGAQSLEKLWLCYGPCRLSNAQVDDSLDASARYHTVHLVESWLRRDKQHSYHILQYFKNTGLEPIVVWWMLTAECRLLAQIRFGLDQHESWDRLCTRFKLPKKRLALIQKHLTTQYNYQAGLAHLQFIEYHIKGMSRGAIWDELENFVLK